MEALSLGIQNVPLMGDNKNSSKNDSNNDNNDNDNKDDDNEQIRRVIASQLVVDADTDTDREIHEYGEA